VNHADDRSAPEAGADMAARLLGWALVLLPPGRREWGRAMRAELAQITSGPQRWRFALSCARVSLTRPHLIGAIRYPLLTLAAITGIVAWTGSVPYPPLRGAIIALVGVLLALSWLARRFGPVGRGRTARLVRAGGYLLVGAVASLIIGELRLRTGNAVEQANTGVPVYTIVLACYMVAFATMTARRTASRVPALMIGSGCGIATAGVCLAPILASPPLPASDHWAIAAIAAATCVAALAGVPWAGGGRQSLIAALCAATVTALLIFVSADGLLQFFSHWVPDTSPANVPAADRLANNIAGVADRYYAVLAIGCLPAVALSVVGLATRRPRPGTVSPTGEAPR
jgi:hypothetical protein